MAAVQATIPFKSRKKTVLSQKSSKGNNNLFDENKDVSNINGSRRCNKRRIEMSHSDHERENEEGTEFMYLLYLIVIKLATKSVRTVQ